MPITIGPDDILRRHREEQEEDIAAGGNIPSRLPAIQGGGVGMTRPMTAAQILERAEAPDTASVDLGGYGKIEVTQSEFDMITSALSQVEDKSQAEALEIRMATALSFSRNLDMPFSTALANLDSIAKAWNGMEYKPTATNYRSILNSFSAGKLSYQRGELGNRLMNASDEGERQAILRQIAQMDTELQGLQDDIPRPWYVDIMKSTGETAYFTLTGIMANAAGGGVVKGALAGLGALGFALNPGLATAIVAGGAALGGFINSASVEGGNLYADLLLNGVEEPVAKTVANFYGSFAGAVEVGLDAFLGPVSKMLGAPTKNVVSRIMSRMLRSGTLGEVGTFAVRYLGGGVSEGMEELIQQIGQNVASDIAYAVSETSDVEPDWNVLEGAAESFVGGFFGSLLLGLPFTAADVRIDFDTAAAIRRDAAAHRSKEEFLNTWRDHPVGGMSTEAWEQHLSDMYDERTKEVLAETEEMIRQGYGSMREASDIEGDGESDVAEDRPDSMPVSRRRDGSLYSQDRRARRSMDGNDFHTLDFASAENPRERYGHVTYRTSQDGTLTIVDVGTQRGYDGLRGEMLRDLIMRHPDMDIRWETRTAEETELRDSLINANPRGREFGLNWTRRNDDDYAKVKARIGTAFSDDDAFNSGFATIIQLLGQKEGKTGLQWFDEHIAEIRKWTDAEQAAADARLDPEDIARGRHALGATTFAEIGDGIRATIYAGRNANPTTFIHELTHVIRKTSGAGEEFRTLFEERLRTDGRFRSFVESNDIIKHKDFNRLFQSDEWTIYDEEFFAELAEAYFRSGHTGSQRVNSLFRRIQDWFRSVYNAIRRSGELNEEVTSYFDRVFGFGEEANARRPSNETEARGGTRTETSEETRTEADAETATADAPESEEATTQERPRSKGEWNKRAFMDEIAEVSSPEVASVIYDGVPVRLLRDAGLIRADVSGQYGLDTDGFVLDPRFSGMSLVDAERMAENARRYQALRESGQDPPPSMLWEGISTNRGSSIGELFQTGISDDITATDEWRDTEASLRENKANFDFAGRHLAPNGELSNLPYREWVTVRTPAFKAWFGDWENDPQNASKVVDENGEPMIVYHGTYASPFRAFNVAGVGSWFTSSMAVASTYGPEIYPVFLDVRNPAETDAMGNGAEDLYAERDFSARIYAPGSDEPMLTFTSAREFSDWLVDTDLVNNVDYTLDIDEGNPMIPFTDSDAFMAEADDGTHDGGIIRNVVDLGAGADRNIESDIFAVFNPEQVKSVENRGTFSADTGDIYYQTGGYNRERSMSNRAVAAYEEGEAPLSKWTKAAFTEAFSEYNSPEVADILSAIPVSILKDIALVRSSWHHTGIFYNPTDFYSLSSLFTDLSEDQAREIVESYRQYKRDLSDFQKGYEKVINDGHAMVTYRPDGENPITVSVDIAPDGTFEADSVRSDGTAYRTRTGILGSDRFSAFYGAVAEGLERMPIKADIIPSSIRRSNDILYQLSPDYVRENMDYETRMPTDEAFLDAVRNTPGASIVDDGIIIDLERWQKPEQDGEASVRTGVFYLPRGASQTRYYRTGGASNTGLYGGSVHFVGETLLKAPLAVKGYTGGSVPLKAYEVLKGKEAASELESDVDHLTRSVKNDVRYDRLRELAEKYGINDDEYIDISDIFYNSGQGNQLRFAFQENVIAHAVREAGYDSVVGYNRNKLTEIFDVREGNYPSELADDPWLVNSPEPMLMQTSLGDDPASAMESDLKAMADAFPTYEQFEEYAETIYGAGGVSERDIEDVWNRFKGNMPEPTIERPQLGAMDEARRDEEFIRLTGEKAGYDSFISALRAAMESTDANTASVRADIESNVPPLLRNVIMGDEASAHAADTIRGYIKADPSFYRDLYGRASGNADWLMAFSLPADIGEEAAEDGKVPDALTDRKRIADGIADEAIRKAVLSGEDTRKSAAVDDAIAKSDERIQALDGDIRKIRDEENAIGDSLGDGNKEALRNWRKADREIARVRKRIDELSREVAADSRRNIPRREGQDVVSDRVVSELGSLTQQLNQLIRQRDSYIRTMKDQEARLASDQRIFEERERERIRRDRRAYIDLWRDWIDEQDRQYYESQRQAREDYISFWRDYIDRQDERYYRQQRDERQAYIDWWNRQTERQHEQFRLAWVKARERRKSDERHRIDVEKATARLSALRERYDEKIAALRAAYRERESLRKVNEYKDRLAQQIMREPSSGVALSYADRIRAIQALIDPERREYVTLGGERFDIETAKAMFRDTPDDPRFAALRPDYIDRLTKKNLNEFTISELEDIRDAVRELRKQGLRERSAYVDAQRARIRQYQNELLAEVLASPDYDGVPLKGTAEERGRNRSLRARARNAYYSSLSMSRLAQILDGDRRGLFYDILIRQRRATEAAELRALNARLRPVLDRMEELGVTTDDMYRKYSVTLDGVEYAYTFSDLVFIYLSQLNGSNRDAVAYGTLMTAAERKAAEDKAAKLTYKGTKAEQATARGQQADAYVREIGDRRYREALRVAEEAISDPANAGAMEIIRMIEEDFNGPAFDRVVRIMNDVYNIPVQRVGYYMPNDRKEDSGKAMEERMKNDVLSTVPGFRGYIEKGYTKDRIEIAPRNQLAVDLDYFGLWLNAVQSQEHLVAATEYVRMLNGIFHNRGSNVLTDAIRSTYGGRMMDEINSYIQEIANPKAFRDKDRAKDIVSFLRGNIYPAYLGLRLSSIVNQLTTSWAPFAKEVSLIELAGAYSDLAIHADEIISEVNRLSPFMESRSFDYVASIIKDQSRGLDATGAQRRLAKAQDLAMAGIEWADRVSVYGGWWAVYKRKRAEFLDESGVSIDEAEKRAAEYADEFVAETQPSGNRLEMASMFKDTNLFARIFLQFQNALNVQWQQIAYDIPQAIRHGEWGKALRHAYGFMLAGVMLMAIREGFDDDDGEKPLGRTRRVLYWMLSQGAASVPLVSSYADMLLELITTGESDNIWGATVDAFPWLDSLSNAARAVSRKEWDKALDRSMESALLLFGGPYSAKSDIEALLGIDALFDPSEYKDIELHPEALVGRRD